jgi:glycosyltransferase involved in cell wall biosynthesis
MGMPIDRFEWVVDRLDARALARSGCDMVFSHRGFPGNSGDVPVIWMNGTPDPEMLKSYFGFGQAEIDEEIAVKGELFRRAAAVQVCTEVEAARLARNFPDIAERFVSVPLFAPDLRSIPEAAIEKHRRANPVRLLFVGNQPWLKGLPETLEVYSSLPAAIRQYTTLTIVSHFDGDRRRVPIPDDPHILVRRGLSQTEVLELMRVSHVLVNVSRLESFGMVFLEAMSQGMLCLGPDWEVQREIFDEGHAGMNLRCEVGPLRAALLRAIEDEDHRIALASAGWRRFNERYAPEIVASKYANLFRTVAAKNSKGGSRP